jgi:choline dehydrogenase-like flavoprotein
MNTNIHPDILIIGSGIGGATIAAGLDRAVN